MPCSEARLRPGRAVRRRDSVRYLPATLPLVGSVGYRPPASTSAIHGPTAKPPLASPYTPCPPPRLHTRAPNEPSMVKRPRTARAAPSTSVYALSPTRLYVALTSHVAVNTRVHAPAENAPTGRWACTNDVVPLVPPTHAPTRLPSKCRRAV